MPLPPNLRPLIDPDDIFAFFSRTGPFRQAEILRRFGYDVENWQLFVQSLLEHTESANIADVHRTPFGTIYVLEGSFQTPRWVNPVWKTYWRVDPDSSDALYLTIRPREYEYDPAL